MECREDEVSELRSHQKPPNNGTVDSPQSTSGTGLDWAVLLLSVPSCPVLSCPRCCRITRTGRLPLWKWAISLGAKESF